MSSGDGQTWPYGAVLPGSSWVGPFLNSGIVQASQPGTFFFRQTWLG